MIPTLPLLPWGLAAEFLLVTATAAAIAWYGRPAAQRRKGGHR